MLGDFGATMPHPNTPILLADISLSYRDSPGPPEILGQLGRRPEPDAIRALERF